MKLILNNFNINSLNKILKSITRKSQKRVDLEINDLGGLPFFKDIMPAIYDFLDLEPFFGIWLKDFPYCAVEENCRDHVRNSEKKMGEKTEKCQLCRYFKKCAGFPRGYFKKYGKEEVIPILDLPKEIMIEVEPRCNFNCVFCFNKVSFAKEQKKIKPFTTKDVKKIIDKVFTSGVKIFRFTGGEPLLRKDFFELAFYAKNKNLEVRLNTNGSLITPKVAKKLKGLVDNVLIPIDSCSNEIEECLNNFKNSLNKKIRAIVLLKKYGIPLVRVGTVASRENIEKLEKISEIVLSSPADEWEIYRQISINKNTEKIKSCDIKLLVDKIYRIRDKTGKNISLANSLPFCSIKEVSKISFISSGSLFDDGRNRLVIDPRGFIKPHYFLEVNLGQQFDILSAWQNCFLKKIRSLDFLPVNCQKCPFVFKCGGGSRYEAKLAFGDYFAPDPLANFKNIKDW